MCDSCGERRTVRRITLAGLSILKTNQVAKTELHSLLFPDGLSCSNSHAYTRLGASGFRFRTHDGFSRFSVGSPNGISLYENAVLLRALRSVAATNAEEARTLFFKIDYCNRNVGQPPTEVVTALQRNDPDGLITALRQLIIFTFL